MTKRDQLGNFELMVMLTLLRLGANAYGVPICDELDKRTGGVWRLVVYMRRWNGPEDKGFVSSELGEPTPQRGGRAKKYFHITDRGLKEVRDRQPSFVMLWQGLAEQGGKE